jgi:putative phosphoesterase
MGRSTKVRVAILSDTHGHIDPRIRQVVEGCDYGVHAGDIGNAAVLESLTPAADTVVAVRGNNDVPAKWPCGDSEILAALREEETITLPGGRLVVVHGHRAGLVANRHTWLRRKYATARVVVYGHSHRLVSDQSKAPWVLNPGAAGRARTFGGPSCLVLHASAHAWHVEILRFAAAQRSIAVN